MINAEVGIPLKSQLCSSANVTGGPVVGTGVATGPGVGLTVGTGVGCGVGTFVGLGVGFGVEAWNDPSGRT